MTKPPYNITGYILDLVVTISEKLGVIKASHLYKPPTELRKINRVKSIQSSLEIEGNTLSEAQITDIIDNKRVLGSEKEILEVKNAINAYKTLQNLNFTKFQDFKKAHKILMQGLIKRPGEIRSSNVGIVKEGKLEHLAPDGSLVNGLMKDLFIYLKNDPETILIKSCVFHYELEFIHPFTDGNGRMGRLWQTLILMCKYPVFEFLPVESLIKKNQQSYYKALGDSDKAGNSNPFIEFMLEIIIQSLDELILTKTPALIAIKRVELFRDKIINDEFSRKDYLLHFKKISNATASRDLKWGVENKLLFKTGDKRLTRYKYLK